MLFVICYLLAVRFYSLFYSNLLFAQNTENVETHNEDLKTPLNESIEHISITGTRLKGIDAEHASPVIVITREDIDASGAARLVDVLKDSTLNLHGSRRESPGGNAQGQATVNLRGLGEQRTLVLINGHRIANSAALPDAQNINLIPLSSIERIEILKDGASSIYGADAIGGVVNIILRKNIQSNGIFLSASKPKSDGGDESNIALYVGVSNNIFSITYSLEHQKSQQFMREILTLLKKD